MSDEQATPVSHAHPLWLAKQLHFCASLQHVTQDLKPMYADRTSP
jgi:hypothetical protein